jgi:hypothetical protein
MNTRLCLAVLSAILVTACGQPQPGDRPGNVPTPTAEPEVASSKDFGDYIVYFNAISTDQLTPEVAKAYSIVRSKNRALLNVSILKKVPGTSGEPVPGSVAAQAANLNGQLKDVKIREIREGESIYYIADVPVSNSETLVFTIDVTPINETSRFSVRFTRQFFTD